VSLKIISQYCFIFWNNILKIISSPKKNYFFKCGVSVRSLIPSRKSWCDSDFSIHIWNKKRIHWSIQLPLLLRHVLTYAVLYLFHLLVPMMTLFYIKNRNNALTHINTTLFTFKQFQHSMARPQGLLIYFMSCSTKFVAIYITLDNKVLYVERE